MRHESTIHAARRVRLLSPRRCRPSTAALSQPNELGGGDVQRAGNSMHVQQTQIPLAALNAADVGSVQLTSFGKLFLRPVAVLPELADGDPERDEFLGPCSLHQSHFVRRCRLSFYRR